MVNVSPAAGTSLRSTETNVIPSSRVMDAESSRATGASPKGGVGEGAGGGDAGAPSVGLGVL